MNITIENKKQKAIELMQKLDIYKPYIKGFNLPEKRQFLYSTDETFTRNKVFTRTCSFDISYIKEGRVAFGFYGPNTDNKTYIGLYTSGENAPVLQLRYRLSLGLGDNSVTETFEDVGITNYRKKQHFRFQQY